MSGKSVITKARGKLFADDLPPMLEKAMTEYRYMDEPVDVMIAANVMGKAEMPVPKGEKMRLIQDLPHAMGRMRLYMVGATMIAKVGQAGWLVYHGYKQSETVPQPLIGVYVTREMDNWLDLCAHTNILYRDAGEHIGTSSSTSKYLPLC